jgi:putative transposase
MVSGLTNIRAEERDVALERYAILQPHIEHNVPLAHLARDHAVHPQTLRRWLHAYRTHGLSGLAPKSRADRGQRRLAPAVLELIRTTALQSPYASIADIHRTVSNLATQEGLPAPSYASVHGVLQDMKVERRIADLDQIASSSDPDGLRFEVISPNERWFVDHLVLDMHVVTGAAQAVQPTLTIVLDDYSRAVVGYYVSTDPPTSETTALALRHAVVPKATANWPMHGVPALLAVDHEEQNTQAGIVTFCAEMQIKLQFALSFEPRGRGKMEYLWETLATHGLDGLLSSNPASDAGIDTATLDRHLTRFFQQYHAAEHPATRQPPVTRWQAAHARPDVTVPPESLDSLLPSDVRRVHHDGVYLGGQRYFTPLLADYLGMPVTVRWDPATPQELRVYADGQYVGLATRGDPDATASLQPTLQSYQHRLHMLAQRARRDEPCSSLEPDANSLLATFVSTRAYEQFAAFCNQCRTAHDISLCVGPTGTGKSWAAQVYQIHTAAQIRTTHTTDRHNGSVVYLPRQRARQNSAQRLDYLIPKMVHPHTELVIIDNSEHLTKQDIHYMIEYRRQMCFGLLLLGQPVPMMRRLDLHMLYRCVMACHMYGLLTQDETEQWVMRWHERLANRWSSLEMLTSETLPTVVQITQGNVARLTRLLTTLEQGLISGNYPRLSRTVICQAIDQIDSTSGHSTKQTSN